MNEGENVRPARNGGRVVLLELMRRVHRGELSPEEAVQILARSAGEGEDAPVSAHP